MSAACERPIGRVARREATDRNDSIRCVNRNDSMRCVDRIDSIRRVDRNDSMRCVDRNEVGSKPFYRTPPGPFGGG